MIIILQGKDVLKFNPVNGRPLKEGDFITHEDLDGRKICQLGDCNKPATPATPSTDIVFCSPII